MARAPRHRPATGRLHDLARRIRRDPPYDNHPGPENPPRAVVNRTTAPSWRSRLLDFDLGAGLFELRLGLLGVFLRGLLEDGLGGAVDEVLGLLEAEAGELPDDLD